MPTSETQISPEELALSITGFHLEDRSYLMKLCGLTLVPVDIEHWPRAKALTGSSWSNTDVNAVCECIYEAASLSVSHDKKGTPAIPTWKMCYSEVKELLVLKLRAALLLADKDDNAALIVREAVAKLKVSDGWSVAEQYDVNEKTDPGIDMLAYSDTECNCMQIFTLAYDVYCNDKDPELIFDTAHGLIMQSRLVYEGMYTATSDYISKLQQFYSRMTAFILVTKALESHEYNISTSFGTRKEPRCTYTAEICSGDVIEFNFSVSINNADGTMSDCTKQISWTKATDSLVITIENYTHNNRIRQIRARDEVRSNQDIDEAITQINAEMIAEEDEDVSKDELKPTDDLIWASWISEQITKDPLFLGKLKDLIGRSFNAGELSKTHEHTFPVIS